MTSKAREPLPTPVREEAPLSLLLRVSRAGAPDQDVVVEADPSATFERVLAEVVRHLDGGIPRDGQGLGARSSRLGRSLDGTLQMAACGLVHGDRLTIFEGAGGTDEVVHERDSGLVARLRVVHAGGLVSEVRLPAGDHVVGRADECDLTLDDGEVSRRHLVISVARDGVAARDLGSRNGVHIDGKRIDGERSLAPGQTLRIGQTNLDLTELRVPRAMRAIGGTVPFNRPPRIAQPGIGSPAMLAAPPAAPPRSRVPMSAALAPLALGLVIYLVTGNLLTLLFLALSPVIAVWSLIEDRRGGRRDHKRETARWRESLSALSASLSAARHEESERRHADSPTLDELRDRAMERTPSLWLRRPSNDDFLRLRLGTADLPSAIEPIVEAGGMEELRAEAEAVLATDRTLTGVPARVDLGGLHVLGLCGPGGAVHALARALIVQAATLHAPSDLTIAAAVSPDALPEWDWLKWLPHAGNLEDGGPCLALGPEEAVTLLESVVRMMDQRIEETERRFGSSGIGGPRILLVLDEHLGLPRALVTSLLERSGRGGVAAIWLGRSSTDLPGSCNAVVAFDSAGLSLELSDVGSGRVIGPIAAETASRDEAEVVALALSPVRETDARASSAGIPRRLRLPPLLALDEISTDDIIELWCSGASELSAPIGLAARAPFLLDLRRDGPHALIAGTTGAGKSELLQTLVAALAATHPPERLTLLLVDYKGGAAFKDCVDLPHTVGFFTDLDASLANRALISLNAELRRREEVLRIGGAKDLLDLQRRGGSAPPSLLIVVDEFATLVNEVPEFVDGVVDVAQRGRSLGVHLILATQRPAGAIGPGVRANTNLRIALRVSDPAESEDVIGSGEAARIPRDQPGRAIARTGLGETTEFQTAFVGARPSGAPSGDRVAVRGFGFGGPPPGPSETITGVGPTDLERIVSAARMAAEKLELAPQPSPWLPPLPDRLTLDDLADPGASSRSAVTIGLLDEPAAQRRSPLLVDLETEGSILFFGASGSGKTTALRTLAVALARANSPDELHIYALDFATGALRGLDALPHCGAVILKDETERVERLVRRLTAILTERKSRPEVTSPRILVLLDDYAGFEAAYERLHSGEMIENMLRLVAEGRSLGLHFAITAGRRSAVPMQLAGLISWRFVLEMASVEEYGILGVSPKLLAAGELASGRGFLDGRTEAQIATIAGDGSTQGQLAALRELGDEIRAMHAGEAPGIGVLPTAVALADMPPTEGALTAAIGLGDLYLGPVAISLADAHFLVLGPYRSGRSTALATIASGVEGAELHLLAPRRTPLTDLPLWTSVAEGIDACTASADQLQQAMSTRTGAETPLIIVVDNGEELTESGPAAALEALARRGRDVGVRIIAAVERQAARRSFGGWVVEMRKEEHGILLDPDPDLDGDLLGARLPRGSTRGLPAGRGYLVERGNVELVQVAKPEQR